MEPTASGRRPSALWRLVPAIPALAGLWVLRRAIYPVQDPDFWWHLAAGRWMVAHGTVPTADPFSVAAAGAPWLDHSWLSELLLFLAWDRLGPAWTCVLGGVLALAAFAVACRLMLREGAGGGAMLLGAVLVTWPLSLAWTVRPLMFTVLGFGLTWWMLRSYRDRPGPRIWWLVPMAAVWANLHGGVIFGLGLAWFFAAGEWGLSRLPGQGRGRLAGREARTLALAALAMTLASLANPRGWKLLVYPFQYWGDTPHKKYIVEWQAPDFHAWPQVGWFLAAYLAVLAFSRREKDPVGILFTVGMVWMTYDAVRNTALMGMAAAPELAAHLDDVLRRLGGWARGAGALGRTAAEATGRALDAWLLRARGTWVAAALAAIMVVGATRATPWVGLVPLLPGIGGARDFTLFPRTGVDRARFPVEEVDFLKAVGLAGPVFSLYDWGGYLVWRYAPERRVLIDGRAEIYPEGHLKEFFRVLGGKGDWRAFFAKWNVRVALLKKNDTAIGSVLEASGEWERRHDGRLATVYVRRDGP